MKPTSMKLFILCILMETSFIGISIVSGQHPVPTNDITNIVVIGATGDLAQRYLWQGFFNLFVEMNSVHNLRLYGATRVPESEGNITLKKIVEDRVQCNKLIVPTPSDCEQLREKYFSCIQYKQLKTADQYKELCDSFGVEAGLEHAKENGRWFYLSVPAFAYAGISENIGKYCRSTAKDTWLRVILEKPFGHDLNSAEELSNKLLQYLNEDDMYRIDHYLGKTGVSTIMPFRKLNQEKYDLIWNKNHIAKVEIVMKETLDVKGRFGFYNKYGVIRDVMQNHLTEILALITMEIPTTLDSPQENRIEKLKLMNRILPIKKHDAVIGQYKGYQEEMREDLGLADNITSLIPTYAGVSLFINSPRWSEIPFILVSGKKMDSKSGYVRIVFKQNTFSANDATFENSFGEKQIIIYTGGTEGTKPMILVSKSLPKPDLPSDWTSSDLFKDLKIFGSDTEDFYYFSPPIEADAYSALLRSCFLGERQRFIATDDLMLSWKIWTPLLNALKDTTPREYPGGIEINEILDFTATTSGTEFVLQMKEPIIKYKEKVGLKVSSFRNEFLKSGSTLDVVAALALDIYNSSLQIIKARGSFHVAFSGGKSPVQLFHKLSELQDFPWKKTHIWLVDERCVEFDDGDSNFKSIVDNLINYINIPYMNVHPMPIQGAWSNCSQLHADFYQNEIKQKTSGLLDYVVLGVGKDGHTASLFPQSPALLDEGKHVTMTTKPSNGSRRISLTYTCLNASRAISVLVTGTNKVNIINTIKDGIIDKSNLPITGISPTSKDVKWFIDDGALIGS